jgi:pilus assembly protein Flp/PilA
MENTQKKIAQEKSEAGASMVEYALIAALIAIVCIGGLTVLGQSASTKFSQISSAVTAAPTN